MKVFIKILDGKNIFYYPNITHAWQSNQYGLKICDISNVIRLAEIFDTEIERDIDKIRRIKQIAENDYNCTIEIMPVNNFLGTYLSTGKKIKAYKIISIFTVFLIILPMIILSIIAYLLA